MTNFEKLLENDKEKIIELIAKKCCIDANKHKIDMSQICEDCIFYEANSCTSETKEWLESEAED